MMSRQRKNSCGSTTSRRPLFGGTSGTTNSGATYRQLDSNIMASTKEARNERTPLLSSIADVSESLAKASFAAQPELQTGVSWGMAAFLLVNTALGAGMLNYPYAYNQIGGILAATLMQIILLVFITSTMFILVYCADLNRDDTYHDVLLSMCGKRAQQLSALSIMLTCYGINITFLVIIGDQYDRIFNSLLTSYVGEYWFLDRKFTIFLTSFLFIWPMCYAQRLDFLRYASILGLVTMLYVAFLTVYEHFRLDEATIEAILQSHSGNGAAVISPSTSGPQPVAAIGDTPASINATNLAPTPTPVVKQLSMRWVESLAVFPVLCFAYQTHEVIVPVYACMKERTVGGFMKATFFALVTLFLLYNLVGAFGYLTFGEHVGADIMSLYDASDPIVVVGIVSLVIKFVTTYPPLMFCGRSALDGLYGEFRKMSPDEFKINERMRRIVISTLWFLTTVALAIFAPDISVTLQLLGSMASINVFVFPGMCLISLTKRLRRARNALLVGEMLPVDYQRDNSNQLYQRCPAANETTAIKCNSPNTFVNRQTNQCQQAYDSSLGCSTRCLVKGSNKYGPKQFTATFASLMEFENNANGNTQSCAPVDTMATNERGLLQCCTKTGCIGLAPVSEIVTTTMTSASHDDVSKAKNTTVASNAQFKHQRRLEEFERLISQDSFCSSGHDQSCMIGRSINDSHDDYSLNCAPGTHLGSISPIVESPTDELTSDPLCSKTNDACLLHTRLNATVESSFNSKRDASLGSTSIAGAATGLGNARYHQNRRHLAGGSWNNRSTSLLDRFSTSIAPSTVAQIGISQCTAIWLYLFSSLLISFGACIFVLEIVDVFGYL